MNLPQGARHRRGHAVLGAVVVLALSACSSAPDVSSAGPGEAGATPQRIVIGSTLPLSGAEAAVGARFKQAYELAVERENADGGVDLNGRKVPVELKLLDDATSPEQAAHHAERLLAEDKVDAFLGSYTSPVVEQQSAVAERSATPYVNGGGAATAIYSRGFDWVFGTLAPVQNLALSEMAWIEEQQEAGKLPTPTKIAVVWEDTSHGRDFRTGIEQFVAEQPEDYSVVADESFPLDGKDYSAVLSKVRSSGAQLFLADAHLQDFITMHGQYVAAGMCLPVVTYGARGPEPEAAAALGRKDVSYVLSAVWWNAQLGNQGLNKDFVDAFRAKYGAEPEWQHAVSYEAARALLTAVSRAGTPDKAAVRNALADLEIESVLPGGTLDFAQNGQAAYPFVVQQNLPDGTSPIIYPADVATGKGTANPSCRS